MGASRLRLKEWMGVWREVASSAANKRFKAFAEDSPNRMGGLGYTNYVGEFPGS